MRQLTTVWIIAIIGILLLVPVSFACDGLSEQECRAASGCEPSYHKIIFFVSEYDGCSESFDSAVLSKASGVDKVTGMTILERIIRFFGGGRGPGRDEGGLAEDEKATYYVYAGSKLLASVEESGSA